jgi:Rieske Fe-S protein
MTHMTNTRRDVLVFGASAFALGASGCAILRGGAVHPQWKVSKASLVGDVLTVPLGDVRAVGEGKVLEVRLSPTHKDLLLSPRADGGVHLITASCPHNGCIVDFDPVKSDWACPCHESRFSLEGMVKGGPAKKNLKVPASRVEGDALVVDLSSVRA